MRAPPAESPHGPVPVLIAGGGPVGSTLALALARAGVAVTLLDAAPPDAAVAADARPIALAASSARILQTLGVWPAIAARACPIRTVHVSQRGCFGAVRLRADEQGVPALGHVVDAASIARALEPALDACAGLTRVRPAAVRDASAAGDALRVGFEAADGWRTADTRLLVAADGGRSALRDLLGVTARTREYGQCAVVCNVVPERAHDAVAWERFTPDGPVALLPLADGRCGVVWSLPEEQAARVAALDDDGFLAALQDAFGTRMGRLREATARHAFPLTLVRASTLTAPRAVLIGNAANQLHPVAGQGLNLGLRDAATLAELVADAVRGGEDPGAPELLADYARRRAADHAGVVRFTDALARVFSVRLPLAAPLRAAGLLALDLLPPAGRALARRSMGLAGRQPRLVRGLLP